MQIQVTYRRTSRLSMRIGRQGEVRVSAPIGMPRFEVEDFITQHLDWIASAQAKTAEREQQRTDFYGQLPLGTRSEWTAAVERLRAKVMPLIERHAAEMGVRPSGVTFRATVSRWGCCNVKTGAIQLSLYLLLLPDWCIESVVVHEMAHLRVPNHGKSFYALMDQHFPRWREARKEMRRLRASSDSA